MQGIPPNLKAALLQAPDFRPQAKTHPGMHTTTGFLHDGVQISGTICNIVICPDSMRGLAWPVVAPKDREVEL